MLKRLILSAFLMFASLNASAQNFTDVYYNPAEPGWGIFLIQSDTFQFLAFFIYGPDGKPTWYTAELYKDPNGNYNGKLYATTGTYFANLWQGAQYNPPDGVGSASFEPSDTYHATLRYSLTGGPTVVKTVQRQTLTPELLAGSYSGSMSGSVSGCPDPADNDAHFRARYGLTVTKTGDTASTLTFTFVDPEHSPLACTMAGALVHMGRLYQLNGLFSCTAPGETIPAAAATIDSFHPTGQGIEGRLTSTLADGCKLSLRFAAVLNN